MRRLIPGLLLCALALFSITPSADGAEAGGKAPEFALRDLDNNEVKLSSFEGNVVLISFWATWCGPCMVEMPHLQKLHDTYKDQGFVLLTINADDSKSSSRVKPLVKSKGFTFPVLLDTQTKVVNQYNPSKTLPYMELLDPQLNVIWRHQGYTPGDEVETEARVKEAIAALAASKVTPQ